MAPTGPVRTDEPGTVASAAVAYAGEHHGRSVAELSQLLRFPSVSAQPKHAADVRRCASWLADHLRAVGLGDAAVHDTPGHPLVVASWRKAPGKPTVLIYGHYDVQPPEPLQQWRTPPFEPSVRGDDLVARGASDDKGQLFAHVKAIEAWLRSSGRLPVNVVCVFEGAEETGSPHLAEVLRAHPLVQAADKAVVSDSAIPGPNRPGITSSLRGALSVEIDVRGPGRDLHSGTFGGAVHNPLQALCEIVAGLQDPSGRIAIPGFYEDVRDRRAERDLLSPVAPSDAELLALTGAPGGWGEPGYTMFERTTHRPALTVNGIVGGYHGPGVKAVIPAEASAKVNIRLVPDQEPTLVDRLLRRHLARVAPTTVRVSVRTMLAARPAVIDVHQPVDEAAAAAYRRAFGRPAVLRPSGGTVPVVSILQQELRLPTVLMGFGLLDDRIHAPNEKLHLPTFFKGIATSIWFLAHLGAIS
jgi:acetylornithine deacetylase/succinyl-diaminopimelate desuccinylase-like protein